jgi:hypothetical protein
LILAVIFGMKNFQKNFMNQWRVEANVFAVELKCDGWEEEKARSSLIS